MRCLRCHRLLLRLRDCRCQELSSKQCGWNLCNRVLLHAQPGRRLLVYCDAGLGRVIDAEGEEVVDRCCCLYLADDMKSKVRCERCVLERRRRRRKVGCLRHASQKTRDEADCLCAAPASIDRNIAVIGDAGVETANMRVSRACCLLEVCGNDEAGRTCLIHLVPTAMAAKAGRAESIRATNTRENPYKIGWKGAKESRTIIIMASDAYVGVKMSLLCSYSSMDTFNDLIQWPPPCVGSYRR